MGEEKIFNFTVGELTKFLSQYPEDMPVVVNGRDSGFENFYPYVDKVIHMPDNWYKDGVFQSDKNGIEVLVLKTEMRYD
ncbi:MAG: hypothetical protein IPN29_18245 [Saprospiraceae bacterium]|nr:hypothetical protein [Saprospiraceae bacterium]